MRLTIRVFAVCTMFVTVSCSSGTQPGTLTRLFAALQARMTSGRQELQRSLEAKKNVKSYRMKIDLTMHPGSALVTEVEVSCPDRERIISHIGGQQFQSVRVGGDAYTQMRNGQWTKQTVPPNSYPCGEAPGAPSPWAMMNEGRDMSVLIASMAGNGKTPLTITPASLTQVNGDTCQPWVVSVQHPGAKGGSGMNYTICLDTHDRLPRQLLLGSGGMTVTYSDWNKPLQIDVPEEAKLGTEVAKAH